MRKKCVFLIFLILFILSFILGSESLFIQLLEINRFGKTINKSKIRRRKNCNKNLITYSYVGYRDWGGKIHSAFKKFLRKSLIQLAMSCTLKRYTINIFTSRKRRKRKVIIRGLMKQAADDFLQ